MKNLKIAFNATLAMLIAVIVLALFAVVPAKAETLPDIPYAWTVTISSPNTVASKTFNIDYQVFSTSLNDSFNATLYQNGASTGQTQATLANGKGGNSGRFTVTVPSDGVYTYYVVAQNMTDSTTKQSKTVTAQVSTPSPIVTTVATAAEPVATTAATATTTAATTQGGETEVAGVSSTAQSGNLQSEVAGAATAKSANQSTLKKALPFAAVAGVIAIIIAGYFGYKKLGNKLDNEA